MSLSAALVYTIIALASVLVYFFKRHLLYWQRRGIPYNKPHFIAGNLKGFLQNRSFRAILQDYYTQYKGTGPFAGFFFLLKPTVLVLDLDLIKNILIKDFNNFNDRGIFFNEIDDPLTGTLFALAGPKWRSIRSKVSATFTSGKMKFMFPTVTAVVQELVNKMDELTQKNTIIETKDIFARYTVDVIGRCAFGMDCNSLKDPQAEFRVFGKRAHTDIRHSRFVDGLMFSFPQLARKLRMRQIHEDVHQFYMRVVRENVEYREKNNVKQNDFLDLLIETKNSPVGMTIEEIAAQSFIFLIAGFETSSSTMGFAMFELALHQDIQDKLRAEINEKINKHGGMFTYECMTELDYMEKVVKETLRKYSISLNLFRKSLVDYPTSDPRYTIPAGVTVLIPTDAIHRDPEIYPDPEKFDPERFSPEETQKRHHMTWLPFGEGPRNCVGLRFGKMQIYVGLAMLLKNYKFYYCDKTPNPLEIDNTSFLLSAKGGIYLRVERI